MDIQLHKIAPPVSFAILGSILLVIGASGIVPIGNPQLVITDAVSRVILVILGILLTVSGLVFFWRDRPTRKSDATLEKRPIITTSVKSHPPLPNHTAAQPYMAKIIEDSLENKTETTVQVIGVALTYSWPFLRDLVTPYLNDGKLRNKLNIELVFIDERWNALQEFKEWHQTTKHTEQGIHTFMDKYRSFIEAKQLNISIWHYQHFPAQHGLLINDETLYRSFCEWTKRKTGPGFELTVGQNRYDEFFRSDPDEKREVEKFEALLEYYKINSREQKRGAAQT